MPIVRETDYRPHSPEAKASSWSRRGVAFLSQWFDVPVTWRVDAESLEDGTTAQLRFRSPHPEIVPSRQMGGRAPMEWEVRDVQGTNPNLTRIAGVIVYVSSVPPEYTDRKKDGRIRPYIDMLFLNGSLGISLPGESKPDVEPTFSLGEVFGLTLETTDQEITVWSWG